MHHQYFKGNYGLYFTVWDRLMGTMNKNYDKVFEEVTSRNNINSSQIAFKKMPSRYSRTTLKSRRPTSRKLTKLIPDYVVETVLKKIDDQTTVLEISHFYSSSKLKVWLLNVFIKRKVSKETQDTLNAIENEH
jgi:hypothetical protein